MKVFKILRDREWREFESEKSYSGSPADVKDGFIHFSTSEQLRGTLEKHFNGEASLVLVSIESDNILDDLKWEPSRGGDLFPHYYGNLSFDQIEDAMMINRDQSGQWIVDTEIHDGDE